MPLGTGAETLQHIPQQDWVMDPDAFFAMTIDNVLTPGGAIADPGAGKKWTRTLPKAGVVSKLRVIFDGTLTVTTAAVTTSDEWPHCLMDGLRLTANGQNDLWSCDGLDLHDLREARYPAFEDAVSVFPSKVGGGDSVAVGTYQLSLAWEIPISVDDTSLVAALFLQSDATNLSLEVVRALESRMFSANPANAAITGNWYIQEHMWEIPFDDKGRMVLPDVTKLHGFNALDVPIANTGKVRVPMVKNAGQLARLFISARSSTTNRLSAAYNAATSKKIDELVLEYGTNQRPLDYLPAATLLEINNQHYHQPLPYDRLCIDRVRENPPRDAVLLQALTELAVDLYVNAGVTITAGQAKARLVQETLY